MRCMQITWSWFENETPILHAPEVSLKLEPTLFKASLLGGIVTFYFVFFFILHAYIFDFKWLKNELNLR